MARSILQNCEDGRYCFFCKKNGAVDPLDKHHVFGGALRKKSESFGLWVYLCHDACHENGPKSVQKNRRVDQALKAWAQKKAMKQACPKSSLQAGLSVMRLICRLKMKAETLSISGMAASRTRNKALLL